MKEIIASLMSNKLYLSVSTEIIQCKRCNDHARNYYFGGNKEYREMNMKSFLDSFIKIVKCNSCGDYEVPLNEEELYNHYKSAKKELGIEWEFDKEALRELYEALLKEPPCMNI